MSRVLYVKLLPTLLISSKDSIAAGSFKDDDLEDNLLKLKWGGSLWHIIKKDSLFHISREEQKQAEPIKHFIMILKESKPNSDCFPSEQISSKKKNPTEMLIMPFEEIC